MMRSIASHLRATTSGALKILRPLAPAATAAVVGGALWLVWRALKDEPPSAILQALKATDPKAVLASAACTAASLLCLAAGEWFSFWVVARKLPPARTFRTALLATALSAAMGFGLASGPALRTRLYRWSGLSAGEILRASLLQSAGTYLSGVVAMGLFVLAQPNSVEGLGIGRPGLIVAAVAMLSPAALWFLILRSPTRPNRRLRAVALSAALGDWLFSGLALFVLSRQILTDLPIFMVVFCLGSLIGAVVGAPASIGVLDAAVLNLHASPVLHETAAALIMYRAIYFLAPLMLAIAYLSIRFVRRAFGAD